MHAESAAAADSALAVRHLGSENGARTPSARHPTHPAITVYHKLHPEVYFDTQEVREHKTEGERLRTPGGNSRGGVRGHTAVDGSS
jgi:hypothetical protein